MFYFLHLLAEHSWPFLAVFKSVAFRAAFAAVTAFLLSVIIGRPVIEFLKRKKIKEDTTKHATRRIEEFSKGKGNTPTMGGAIMIISFIVTLLLWSRPDVVFIPLCCFTMLALGAVGAIDDWIKLTDKTRDGLSRREKIFYQCIVGAGIGLTLSLYGDPESATKLIVPFTDGKIFWGLGLGYILWSSFVITATSNAVNFTDGLDGLASLCVITVTVAFGLIAYFAGHAGIADYLSVTRVPGAQELAVACAALAGSCMGFLWYNAYPAEVFMGDTGSLALGGMVGLTALCVKQELLLIIVGGIFVGEALSVIIQIISFRFTGKRVFLCSPIHHHFQKLGWHETKIVTRFFIISALLAVFSVAALRIRL